MCQDVETTVYRRPKLRSRSPARLGRFLHPVLMYGKGRLQTYPTADDKILIGGLGLFAVWEGLILALR